MFVALFLPKMFTGYSLCVTCTQVWHGLGGVGGRNRWGVVKMNEALPYSLSRAATSETCLDRPTTVPPSFLSQAPCSQHDHCLQLSRAGCCRL